MQEKLDEYVSIFDYIDKALIFLTPATGGVSIISIKSITDVPV